MTLDELKVYQMAMELGERVWKDVMRWDRFPQDTIGRQLVKAADSIAANLSEGYGRYHYLENRHFSYYSRGSLFETKTWLQKAANRGLISSETFASYENEIHLIGRMLNAYIKSIGDGNQAMRVRESGPDYLFESFPMTSPPPPNDLSPMTND